MPFSLEHMDSALCKVFCYTSRVLVRAIPESGIEPDFGAESQPAQKPPG